MNVLGQHSKLMLSGSNYSNTSGVICYCLRILLLKNVRISKIKKNLINICSVKMGLIEVVSDI